MFQFLSRMFSFVEATPASTDDTQLETAMEAVLDGTDPRLRLLPNYQQTLRPATLTAITHVRNIAAQLGAPTELSRAGFAADPRIHTLFCSADSLLELINRDANVRAFVAESAPASQPHIHAVLIARRSSKQTLGMKLMGEVLANDVPQTVLNFSDHKLVGVSGSADETLSLVKRSAFRQLIHYALGALTAAKTHRSDRDADILKERMNTLASMHSGNEHPFWPTLCCKGNGESAHRLNEIDHQLTECTSSPCTLDDYLAIVVGVLSHPECYLSPGRYTAVVDRMGIILDKEEADQSGLAPVSLPEVTMPELTAPLVTLPVRLIRADIHPYTGLKLETLL